MKLPLLAAGLLSLIATSASAQVLAEQQKRQAHVPYVRAATDCYARAIAVDPTALDLARTGRLFDALTMVEKTCEASVLGMIQTHDQLYGAGTGVAFFQGPYVQDLPRAVGNRLKAAIARRTMEIEQANAARHRRIEEATRTRNLLRDRMYDCTTNELSNLVASSETADVLATAAMTVCRQQVQATIDAFLEVARAEGRENNGLWEVVRDIIRKNVMTNAVQVRAAAVRPPAETRPRTQPVAVQQAAGGIATPETCLKTASSIREGRFVETDKLVSMMLELCRPEIENSARATYLADPSQDLAELRGKALEGAVSFAESIVTVQ